MPPQSEELETCRVNPETQAVGTFLAKADGVLAGLAVADEVWHPISYLSNYMLAAFSGTQLATAHHVTPGM